jgi:hypothetical protein
MGGMAKIEPYGEFKEVAPDLYCLDGEWQESAFKRRMTVVRLKSGGTFVHNAIQLEDQDYAKLERIGTPEVIVAPNVFHGSDAHHYKKRYPKARLLVSKGAAKSIAKLCPVDGVLPAWDEALRSEVDCLEAAGMRWLHESLFFHRASRTLLVTDLIFNMQTDFKGFERKFARWNRIDKKFGPSRIFKLVFVKDRKAVSEFLSHVLKWDFDRVVVNHGDILDSGGRELFRKSFSEMGML